MGRPHPVEWRWRNADNRVHNPSRRVKMLHHSSRCVRSQPFQPPPYLFYITLSSDKSRHPKIISIQSLENFLYRLYRCTSRAISISRERSAFEVASSRFRYYVCPCITPGEIGSSDERRSFKLDKRSMRGRESLKSSLKDSARLNFYVRV